MPKIVMVGNSSYRNRGCEAIVRGTVEILRAKYGEDIDFELGMFCSDADLAWQKAREYDPRINSWSLSYEKWSVPGIKRAINTRFNLGLFDQTVALKKALKDADFVLQVGGDNYSLDYGRPGRYFRLDRALRREKLRTYLWGASVGPFSADPEFEPQAINHLKGFDGILTREPASEKYLLEHGLGNIVKRVVDPAFMMQPRPPAAGLLPEKLQDYIGINLSPIMWRYAKGGSIDRWKRDALEFVTLIARQWDKVLMVPHVTADTYGRCDAKFMDDLHRSLPEDARSRVTLLSADLNAAELKYCIGKLGFFVGARTHSTIAGLSLGVPTVSIAYSIKARGINEDLFGDHSMVIEIDGFSPSVAFDRVKSLWERKEAIREKIVQELPRLKCMSSKAADLLPAIS